MPGRTEGSDSNQMLSFNHDRFSGGKNHVGLRLLLLREIGDRFGVIGRIHNTKEGGTMKKHSLINLSQALILLTKPVLGILVMVFCVPLMLSGLASAQTAPEDFKVKIVKAPDGVLLYAQEWGNASGPEILFIHGFSQSHLSFIKQTRSDLAKTFRMVTYDLRGHGGSDKPSGSEYYKEGKRWAGDVQAVIEALNLKKPVLVGWSMGGRVISQYLTDYGEKRISGINFVSSMTIADPKSLGPGSLNYLSPMLSPNLEINIAATRAFVRACTAKALLPEEFALIVAFNMTCPAYARDATRQWPGEFSEVLAKVTVPVLVTHGKADEAILPAAAERTASLIKGAKLSWYEFAGHMPFWEDPAR